LTPFSKEDKILTKNLYECRGYNARQHFNGMSFRKNVVQRTVLKRSGYSIQRCLHEKTREQQCFTILEVAALCLTCCWWSWESSEQSTY